MNKYKSLVMQIYNNEPKKKWSKFMFCVDALYIIYLKIKYII